MSLKPVFLLCALALGGCATLNAGTSRTYTEQTEEIVGKAESCVRSGVADPDKLSDLADISREVAALNTAINATEARLDANRARISTLDSQIAEIEARLAVAQPLLENLTANVIDSAIMADRLQDLGSSDDAFPAQFRRDAPDDVAFEDKYGPASEANLGIALAGVVPTMGISALTGLIGEIVLEMNRNTMIDDLKVQQSRMIRDMIAELDQLDGLYLPDGQTDFNQVRLNRVAADRNQGLNNAFIARGVPESTWTLLLTPWGDFARAVADDVSALERLKADLDAATTEAQGLFAEQNEQLDEAAALRDRARRAERDYCKSTPITTVTTTTTTWYTSSP